MSLFVEVIEPHELPTRSGLLEMIYHYFISGCVGACNTVLLRIFRVLLRSGFRKTGYSISLFVKKLPVTFTELHLGPDARNAVRHLDWKL